MSNLEQTECGTSIIQACRACLDTKSINYLQFDSEGGSWAELYHFCTGFTITPEIGSQLLCQKCSGEIRHYADFKKQCHKSEEFWCSLLANDSNDLKCSVSDAGIIKEEGSINNTTEYNCLDDTYFKNIINKQHEDVKKLDKDLSDKDFETFEEPDFDKTDFDKSCCKRKRKLSENTKNRNCDKCHRNYKNGKCLNNHLEKCQGKGKRVETKKLKQPNKDEVIYCGLCDFTSNYELMKQHLNIHALSNDLNCRSCDFVGKDFASMVSHRYSHQPKDSKPTLFCHLCNSRIRSCSSLQYHYRTLHLNKHGLDCTMCNKSFKTYKSWRNHDRWHRVDKYICDICGKKFLFRHAIETHLIDHLEYNKFICETCGRGFKRLFNLKCHVINRHSIHAPVKCAHCNKTFKSEFTLQTHLRLVTKEKPFGCPVCPKKFPSETTMKNHLFWHSGERPFSCEICGSKYKAKSQLKVHMRQHTGIMPFKCQHCDKSFASSNQLRVHTSVHTGIRRHKCSYCPRSFHSRKLVQLHCASQHKDVESNLNIST